MLQLARTNSAHPDFVQLVQALDADLALRDGADHAFYAQFNKIVHLNEVVLAYAGPEAVGCGALKPFALDGRAEIKRMYTRPPFRGKGVATQVLGELEHWAAELGYTHCVLETGKKQPEAISLYLSQGYRVIPNYGQYAGVENSICFEKKL